MKLKQQFLNSNSQSNWILAKEYVNPHAPTGVENFAAAEKHHSLGLSSALDSDLRVFKYLFWCCVVEWHLEWRRHGHVHSCREVTWYNPGKSRDATLMTAFLVWWVTLKLCLVTECSGTFYCHHISETATFRYMIPQSKELSSTPGESFVNWFQLGINPCHMLNVEHRRLLATRHTAWNHQLLTTGGFLLSLENMDPSVHR